MRRPKSTPKPKTPPLNPYFKPGAQVEINSDDPGFRGSFYSGTVIRRASAKTPEKYVVQYEKIFEDEKGTKPVREIFGYWQLRPPAPRENNRRFKFSEEVDAYHNDGWWEGVITKDYGDGKFDVFFRSSKEELMFEEKDLRQHREWVNEEWKPPLEEQEEGEEEQEQEQEQVQEGKEVEEVQMTTEVKPCDTMEPEKVELQKVPHATEVKPIDAGSEEKFSKGALVEVSSDEDGFKGAWFAATIVEAVGKDKYLVEYQSLRTEDDTDFLREEIDILHIRPRPPETIVASRFKLLEEVDALYQDGWWVGVISKVLTKPDYVVYFRDTKEEMEFQHPSLRVHQDWINGKWVMASQGLNL